jgi:hypothetical protein
MAPPVKRTKFGELPAALESMFALLPFFNPEASSMDSDSSIEGRKKRARAAEEAEPEEERPAPLSPGGAYEPAAEYGGFDEFDTTGGEPVAYSPPPSPSRGESGVFEEPRTPGRSRREEREASMAESVSKRTELMRSYLKKTMTGEAQSFNALFADQRKRRVAQSFFELLVLKSKDYIDLQQDHPYADITIKKTEKFNTLISVE